MRPPYVHEWAQGTIERRYYRRGAFRRVLPARVPFSSPAFIAAYAAAAADFEAGAASRPAPTQAGSVDAHVSRYLTSHEFLALAPNTQKARRNLLRRWTDMTINDARVGGLPTKEMREGHVRRVTGELRPQTRRVMHMAIRAVLDAAIERGELTANVAGAIKTKVPKGAGRHTWTPDEIARYRAHWPAGSRQRTAMDLLVLTGQRRGDAITMGWHMVKDRILSVRQEKTGALAHIPMRDELAALTAGLPLGGTWMRHDGEGPWASGDSFGNAFREWVSAAGLPMRCSAHGLRKAFCCVWAEKGYSAQQIGVMSGHLTLQEVERYTAAIDRRKMAVAMLADGT